MLCFPLNKIASQSIKPSPVQAPATRIRSWSNIIQALPAATPPSPGSTLTAIPLYAKLALPKFSSGSGEGPEDLSLSAAFIPTSS